MQLKKFFTPERSRRLGRAALVIISVILATLSIFAFNFEQSLMKAEPYKAALLKADTYQRLPGVLAERQITILQKSGGNMEGLPGFAGVAPAAIPYLQNLDAAELEGLVNTMFPTNWLQIKLENILDQYFAGMERRIAQPDVRVALSDLRSRLKSNIGDEFMRQLILAQPNCSANDVVVWQDGAAQMVPPCQPPANVLNPRAPMMRETLDVIIQEIPEEIEYKVLLSGTQDTGNAVLNELQSSARTLWGMKPLLLLGPILALAAVVLLGMPYVSKPGQLMRFWGRMVIAIALCAIFVTLIDWPILQGMIIRRIPGLPYHITPGMVKVLLDVAKFLSRELDQLVLVQALLLGVLGVGLYISPRWTFERKRYV